MSKLLSTVAAIALIAGIAKAATFNYSYPVLNEPQMEQWFALYRSGVGYTVGLGGSVTQLTSRTTGVTLNNPTGAITMFTAAGSATAATFTVTDSFVEAGDTIVLSQKSGTNLYEFFATAVAAGSFNVTFFTTGGTSSDAPVINFAILKGAAS